MLKNKGSESCAVNYMASSAMSSIYCRDPSFNFFLLQLRFYLQTTLLHSHIALLCRWLHMGEFLQISSSWSQWQRCGQEFSFNLSYIYSNFGNAGQKLDFKWSRTSVLPAHLSGFVTFVQFHCAPKETWIVEELMKFKYLFQKLHRKCFNVFHLSYRKRTRWFSFKCGLELSDVRSSGTRTTIDLNNVDRCLSNASWAWPVPKPLPQSTSSCSSHSSWCYDDTGPRS